LGTIKFTTDDQATDPLTGEALSTNVRYTDSGTSTGYDFLTGNTTLEAKPFSLDVDGDGSITAFGDGMMVIRKLIGPAFADDALTHKTRSADATRSSDEIHQYIQNAIDNGTLDVDRDGRTTAFGDGMMVIRKLIGPAFAGDALINKTISADSRYFGEDDASDQVAANIDALKPPDI